MSSHQDNEIVALRDLIKDFEIGVFYADVFRQIAAYDDCEVKLTSVLLNRTKLLVNKIIKSRVESAHQLLLRYLAARLEPFEPIGIKIRNGKFRIVSPPTAEIGREHLVMDGSHRIFAAQQAGLKEVSILEIRSTRMRPPASEAFGFDQIEIVQSVGHWTDRTVNFRPELFRPVPIVLDKLSEQVID